MNIILGAGPAGLSAGYEFVKNNKSCMIVEKDTCVGGISKTLRFGDFLTDVGPHRFFSKNPLLYQMIEELLHDDWIPVPRLTRQYIEGKYYDYPVKAIQAVMNAGIKKAFQMVIDFAIAILRKTFVKPTVNTFEEWVVLNFGRNLAEFNLINYTEKIWGISTRYISASWAEQRIKGVSIFEMLKQDLFKFNKQGRTKVKSLIDTFYYPLYGIGEIYEAMAKKITEQNNPILFESYAQSIQHNANGITKVIIDSKKDGSKELICDNLISSIPITELVQILDPPAPPEVIKAAKELRYRDQRYVFLMLNREKCTDDTWIYFPTTDIPFGRMMEPKNWTEKMSPPGKTSLFVEYFCFEGDKIWNMDEQKLIHITVKYLEALKFLKKEEVMDAKVINLKKAYPVWDLVYKKKLDLIKKYLSQFSNLYIVGRNGRFHYNNQDHSIETGILASRSIIESKKYDLEVVGMENEYFEKGALNIGKKIKSAPRDVLKDASKDTQKVPKKPSWTQQHPKAAKSLSLTGGLALIVFILFYTGIDKNLDYLQNMNLGWICLAGIIFLTSYFIRGIRWKTILIPYQSDTFNPSLFTLNNYEIFGGFMNLVLPLKLGDVTKAIMVGRRNSQKITSILASVVLERIFDLILLGFFILIPVYYFGIEIFFKEDVALTTLFGFALIFVVIIAVIILIFKKDWVLTIINKLLVIIPFVRQRPDYQIEITNVFEQLNLLLKASLEKPLRIGFILVSSAVIWFLESVAAFYVAKSFGLDIELIVIISGVIIGNFLKSVPATPAGIGFYELGFYIVLSVVGVAEAAVIAIIDHLIKNIILLIVGGIITISYGFNPKKIQKYAK